MLANDIKSVSVQFRHDGKAPLVVKGTLPRARRLGRKILRGPVCVSQIGDNGRALCQRKIPILKHGNFLSRVQLCEFSGLSFPGARSKRAPFIGESQLMECPMRPHRAWRSSSPKNPARYFDCRGHFRSVQCSAMRQSLSSRKYLSRIFGDLQAVKPCVSTCVEFFGQISITRAFAHDLRLQMIRVSFSVFWQYVSCAHILRPSDAVSWSSMISPPKAAR